MSSLRPPTLKEVCDRAKCLPCAPTLLPKLVAALQKEEGTAQEIEAIIFMDTSLAAATLRLANSPIYGGAGVDSLGEAILRLGAREIYRLAALALVSRWDTGQMNALNWQAGDFLRHTLCTALAAEALAEMTGRIEASPAYTAGLVCGLGKLAMAHSCALFYADVRDLCERDGRSWEDAEIAVLGYSHAAVGAHLLRAWRFPEVLSMAMEYQAKPEFAPVAASALVAHLNAAQYLAVSMGPGVCEDSYRRAVNGAFLERMGFTSQMLEETLPIVLERASVRMGEHLTTGVLTF